MIAEAAKGLTTAEEGQEEDDSDSSTDKKKKKQKEKEKKKKEKEVKKKEKKDSKKEKGSSGEKEKLVNSSSKSSDVASSPAPSAPSGVTTSGGAFVPSAQAPPIEEVDEGEDEDEEDEEEEQDSQAGVQTVGGSNRPLSSNIRTSPGYISGSGVQYRPTSYTSSFQQNNLSGDSSRINNTNSSTNSDAVLMRPLSEDRQRLVQQMPGHYHGAITALGSGPGAVPPLATPEDTGV